MAHIPFGYIIENGRAVIDEEAAEQVKELFDAYLSGLSLAEAAKKVGISRFHAGVAKILTNKWYLGDGFYPAIIDEDIFKQAEVERLRRAQMLGRIFEPKEQKKASPKVRFTAPIQGLVYEDPFMQAEYVYSLIESEVTGDVGE